MNGQPTDDVIEKIRDIPIYQDSLASGHFPVLDVPELSRGFPGNWMTPRLATALEDGEAQFFLATGPNHTRMRIIQPPHFLLRWYYHLWRNHPDIARTWESGCRRVSLTSVLATEHVSRANAARRGVEPERAPALTDRWLDERTCYLNLRLDPARWTREDVLRMLSEIDQARSTHPQGWYHLDCSGYHLAHLVRKVEAWGLEDLFAQPASIIHTYEYTPMNVRRFLRRRFACPIIDLFGSTELGYLYYSDKEERYWPHLDGMSVELLPVPGGAMHQLIVTSVRNPYMPLVRYRSGTCVRTLDGTPDPSAITEFCGQFENLLSTPNGPIAQGDLDRHIASASPRIFLRQLCLHGAAEATLLYTTFTGEPLGGTEKKSLRQSTGELTGRICRVEHRTRIPIGPSGKYAWLTPSSRT